MKIKFQRFLTRAIKFAKKGKTAEARKLYTTVLGAYPLNHQAKKGLEALQKNQLGPLQKQIRAVIALYSSGQIQEALGTAQTLTKDYPNEPVLFNISGVCYKAIGQLDASVQSFEKAVAIKPNYAEGYFNLGIVLKELDKLDAAVESYEKAIAIKPDYAEAHNNLGSAFRKLGLLYDAAGCYKKAVTIKTNYAEAHYNLGITLQDLGQQDAAVKSYEKALAIKPDYAEWHFSHGIVLMELGLLGAAVKSYEKALAIKPDYAEAHHNLSAMKQYTINDPQISVIQSILSTGDLSLSDRTHLCFTLAKVNEDLERPDELFKFLHEGNRLRKLELNYSLDRAQKLSALIRKLFSSPPSVDEKSYPYTPSTIRPVFIVGMPRSGTSLVEQIIASHHAVHGAGELNILANLISKALKDHLTHFTDGLPEKAFLSIRQQYLDSLSRFNVPENIITDKMPLNFRYIGFILSAFPEAKIIHLKRDARATCWSIYKHYFTKGNGFSFNQEDLAGFYGLYTDLMIFWHELFPDKIYDISYEELTTNQEKETQKLLKYCELDWDENCLNFHTSKRAVKTASALQVRQKMYQGSSEAWKKYEAYLQPLIKGLSSY